MGEGLLALAIVVAAAAASAALHGTDEGGSAVVVILCTAAALWFRLDRSRGAPRAGPVDAKLALRSFPEPSPSSTSVRCKYGPRFTRLTFGVDDHVVEALLHLWTGLEIYRVDGAETLRLRSHKITGARIIPTPDGPIAFRIHDRLGTRTSVTRGATVLHSNMMPAHPWFLLAITLPIAVSIGLACAAALLWLLQHV